MLVYIGLGSNLDNPLSQVKRACKALKENTDFGFKRVSSWFESDPVGPAQPNFINAVAELETALEPEELLNALQAIEQNHQRVRTIHWGPRTLDLDILLYGQQQINSPRLTVPHRFIKERSFVLTPLAELAPQLTLPDGTRIAQLAKDLGTAGLRRLS